MKSAVVTLAQAWIHRESMPAAFLGESLFCLDATNAGRARMIAATTQEGIAGRLEMISGGMGHYYETGHCRR